MKGSKSWIIINKDYLQGLGIIISVGALFNLIKTKNETLSIFLQIPIAILTYAIMISIIGGLILLLSWPFYRNFKLLRFLKISIVIGIILDISTILSFGWN